MNGYSLKPVAYPGPMVVTWRSEEIHQWGYILLPREDAGIGTSFRGASSMCVKGEREPRAGATKVALLGVARKVACPGGAMKVARPTQEGTKPRGKISE